MSKQLTRRVALPLLRHALDAFNRNELSTDQACHELGVSRSRLFDLRRRWLAARRRGEDWAPGCSGGDHKAPWPPALTDFLRMKLMTDNLLLTYSRRSSRVEEVKPSGF